MPSITRTIVGNLAADPVSEKAGNATVTRFRVIENTGEYRNGAYVEHDRPTTHAAEAWFELGENITETLHKGDRVILVGREHTESYQDKDGNTQYPRVFKADFVGVDLTWATAVVTKKQRTSSSS